MLAKHSARYRLAAYFVMRQELNAVTESCGYQELPDWAQRAWQLMIAKIQEFRPDVVVLTARKMPRVVEGLQTYFGEHAIVISDLAIPFSSSCLANARVAVIDDVVNVGSTLEHIAKLVQRQSPAAIRFFSLAARTPKALKKSIDIFYGHSAPLTETDYSSYVRTVPAVISHICKPYDLVFPVIQARYQIPFRSTVGIVDLLEQKYGKDSVQVIPTPYVNSPIRRVSLLFNTEDELLHKKLRLIFNDQTQTCCIVPMVIPHCIEESSMPVYLPWVIDLRNRLTASLNDLSVYTSEPKSSILLFTTSLDWFLSSSSIEYFNQFLQFDTDPFSICDAKAVFGLQIERILKEMPSVNYKCTEHHLIREVVAHDIPESIGSPFLEGIQDEKLAEDAVTLLRTKGIPISDAGIDCYGYLLALMGALSNLVGGEKPSEYKAVWPYSKEQIDRNPYLRLRIGPTFSDILSLISKMYKLLSNLNSTPTHLADALSITLDALIDQGAIVPTFGNYNNKVYRVYRRGEGPGQDICDKVVFAIGTQEKPISVTRLAKVLATFSHSQKYHKFLKSSACTRGCIGGCHKTVLGSEPENIPTYLRNTGQLKAVEK